MMKIERETRRILASPERKSCSAADKKGSRFHIKKRRRGDLLKPVCWLVVPVMLTVFLVLDGVGIYAFNTERLIVLGVGLLVSLLPFFSEIRIRDLTVRRSGNSPENRRER